MCSTEIFLENERVLIHPLGAQDLDALTAMRNDRQIYRYEPTFLAELQGSPEDALRTIMRMDLADSRQCILGIYDKTDPNILAGLAEFYDYKPSGKVISVGCRLRPEYWGRGICSACLKLLIEYIRNQTKVEMITAQALPANKASAKILLNHGFQYLLTKPEDWGFGSQTIADVYAFDVERSDAL